MMKKILLTGSLLGAGLILLSCSKEEAVPQDMVTTRIEAMTAGVRTSLSGKKVVWDEDDKVCCIATYDKLGRYSVYTDIVPSDVNEDKATIEISCPSAFTPSYIVYPSSSDVVYSPDSSTISVPFASSFPAVKGNIPAGINIAIGVIDGNRVEMRNAMSVLKFELDVVDTIGIASITFSTKAGELLSGNLSINPETMEFTGGEGTGSIAVVPGEDEVEIENGVYYIPVPAISLSSGFTMKIKKNNGSVATKSYSQALTLNRNRFLNLGKESEWGLIFQETTKTIGFVSTWTGQSKSGWPFTTASPSADNIIGKGLSYPFYPPLLAGFSSDNSSYGYKFFVATKVNTDSFRSTAGSGLRFGGTSHDYMLLPAIPGFILKSVTLKSGKGVTYAITENPASGAPKEVSGGASKAISSGASATFLLAGTKEGVSYRLDLPTAGQMAAILELYLTYEMSE